MNKIKPPGMGGTSLYYVLKFFFTGLASPNFTIRAMAMAYRFFFAVFPAMIIVFTLLPYFPIENMEGKLREMMVSIMPGQSLGFLEDVVAEFFNKPSAGIILLNIGLLLFSTLSGVKVMMAAFDRTDEIFKRRNFIRNNIVALSILVVLIILLIVTVAVYLLSGLLVDYLTDGSEAGSGTNIILQILHWLVMYLFLQISVSVIYFLAPTVVTRWSFFSPGSIFAGLLLVFAIVGSKLFFSGFSNYNKIYGSLGTIMILMVWFYWISIVLLLGFELNRAIHMAKHRLSKRSKNKLV